MNPRGLRPHTHAERMAAAHGLVPLLRDRFGDGLRAVALSGSLARGEDRAFSDVEMVVFLRDPPAPGEDAYLQRVVDAMLVEAEYLTEEAYVARRAAVGPDWYLAASDHLLALYGADVVERIMERVRALRPAREAFLRRAARRFLEVQESFGKVLGAIGAGDREAVGLLLWDGVHHLLVTLSFLNEQPFTTFARFIPEARSFARAPPGLNALLDRVAEGRFNETDGLRDLLMTVFAGMEAMFGAEGVALYDASLDPAVPNRLRP
ncbi:hypothetical protein [Longimicrobium sp.]|uniref:hypothetical protein n=1 Tax=Longimicrobium sp. TaxID=2029185 RepID=UPI002E365F1B|nr:hypothetical protein [Longimicrobium sp.]HEX6039120.1 hypothetical protein [Longimicrobium sp.]